MMEKIVGLYGVLKPALLAAYRQHLAESNPITDHPIMRIIRFMVAEEEQMLAWGEKAIAAQSQLPAETFDFVTFLTSKAGQERWVELIGARSISPIQDVARSEEWLRYGGSTGEIILDALAYAQPPPVNFGNAPEAENIWNQDFALMVAGEESVADAVANICPQIEPILPS